MGQDWVIHESQCIRKDKDSIRVSFEAEAKEDCEPERPYLRNGDPGTPGFHSFELQSVKVTSYEVYDETVDDYVSKTPDEEITQKIWDYLDENNEMFEV